MGGFNLQSLMSQAKQQYENLQKKMQETVVEDAIRRGGGEPSARFRSVIVADIPVQSLLELARQPGVRLVDLPAPVSDG